jgi:hypothetical protein
MNDTDITKQRFANLEIGGPKKTAAPVATVPNPQVFTAPSNPIKGTATRKDDGTWVNALGLESTDTHRHVSVIWQQKCIPFGEYFDQVKRDAKFKRDVLTPESEVRLDSDLCLPDGTQVTDNGVDTIRSFTDVKSTTVANLNELGYRPMIATVLNSELDKREIAWAEKGKTKPRDFRIRLRHDNQGHDVARAIVSERYGVIDNDTALQMLVDALPNKSAINDALMSHGFDDGDNMYGNVLLPDYLKSDVDSDYGVGIAFRNSEIRKAVFRIDPFLFRAICLNGCIWGRMNSEIKINQKHLGNIDLAQLRADVKRAVTVALTHGNSLLVQMGHTREVEVENVDAIIAQLSRANRLTIEQGRAWQKGYTDSLQERMGHIHDGTAFGVVNGLTRAAQSYTGEDRTYMETIAGLIMTPSLDAPLSEVNSYWQDTAAQAKRLDEETVKLYVAR